MASLGLVPKLISAPATSLLAQIGNTPLLKLEKMAADLPGVEIYGKAEFFNPGGSVKDRPALNMILEGERTGQLHKGRILLDSTSGNTGIAYAMICAVLGYRVLLCLPANASEERKRMLKAYGAEMILTDPAEGSDGAIRKCREIYEADPDKYFYPDQYSILQIGRPTSRPLRWRSWSRPKAGSRTSWLPWERAARLLARRAG